MSSHHERSPSPINWRKFIWLGLVLLAVGYIYGQPTLEKWLGIDLPDLNGGNTVVTESESDRGASETVDTDRNGDSRESGSESNERPSWSSADRTDNDASRFELETIGRNRYRSPAGLVYEPGPGGEHRIDHILRHAQDDPSRPVHSVFDGDRDEILALLDEAYRLIQQGSDRVRREKDSERNWREEYTIDMGRIIGYEGGRSGKRKGYPKLKRLKLILDNDVEVVTAYPYR